MANINSLDETTDKSKQLGVHSWLSFCLPAICAGTLMAVALLLAISCSRKSDQPAAKTNATASPAVASPAPSAGSPMVAKAKKIKRHRPPNATYVNSQYGISFSYPRKYSLQVAGEPSSMLRTTNFVRAGAIGITSLELPGDAYPQTNYSSASLSVSINPALTAEECVLFPANTSSPDQMRPESVKLGGNEFTAVEQTAEAPEHRFDRKYFHLFTNRACYEFAMEVETSLKVDESFAPLDRDKVFERLEKIVASARIKQVELPQTLLEAAKSGAAPARTSVDSTVEKSRAVPAEQK
ncbi:MAG: hypothetical protein JO159_17180 [Acidobacteria bacterium]|nr:hypothetical protein [Acidobacteriota bacterium]